MKKQSMGSVSNIFLIVLLIVFFMLLYVYGSNPMMFYEKFAPSDKNTLIPSDQLAVYQGNTLPDTEFAPINFDKDESLPTVDGKEGSDKAMFMMAFNKCDPSCCPSTYSCSGGCVCMTDDQKNFIGTRGANNKSTKCSGISEY